MLNNYYLNVDENSELELLKRTVKQFCDEEIVPGYEQWEKSGLVPRELYTKLGEAGLLCADVPEVYGGYGASPLLSFAVIEMMGYCGYTGFAASMEVHTDITPRYLLNFGTEEQKCADTSELFFDDLRVPVSALLGSEGQGFVQMMRELPRERLIISVLALGAAKGVLDSTLKYVEERQAFGSAISKFQNTRFKLAEVKTRILMIEAFLQHCTHAYCRGELEPATAAALKLSATEMQALVADECLQLFGGYGYMTEYPISRAWVDARVQRIYGGTSEIMKEVIGRSMLGR